MNTLKIFLIASTLLLTNAANALSNPVIDQCSEESLNTIQLEMEDLKELADYKLNGEITTMINNWSQIRFKRLRQSCMFEPQNAYENYALIKTDMETSAKIIDMGFDAWKDSLPLQ
jgi:hypothetical protein